MRLISLTLLLVAAVNGAPATTKRDTTWCGSFGTLVAGPYTVFHNNFGASTGSGQQCTTFHSLSGNSVSWSTSWSWSGGASHVKSYSNIALQNLNKGLSTINSIPSTWSWKYTGSSIVADVSYDLWLAPSAGANDQYEIMVWLAALGGAGPISETGSPIATPTINGATWRLYRGPNGSTTVFSFVADTTIVNWNGDMKKFLDYLTANNGVSTTSVVTHLQAGTEPFTGSNAFFETTQYTMSLK